MSSWPSQFPFSPQRLVDSPDYNLIIANLTGSQIKTGSFAITGPVSITGSTFISGNTYLTGNLIYSGSASSSNLLARPDINNVTTIYDINGNIMSKYLGGRQSVFLDATSSYLLTDLVGNVLFKINSGSFSATRNMASIKLLYGSLFPGQIQLSGSFISTGFGVIYYPQVSSRAKITCTLTGTNLTGGTTLITGLIVRTNGSTIPALNTASSSYPNFVVDPRVVTLSVPTGNQAPFSLQIIAMDDGVFRGNSNAPLIAGQAYNYSLLLSGSNVPIELDSVSIIAEEI